MQIYCGNRHFFVVENGINLFIRFTTRSHLENSSDDRCRRLVSYGKAFIARTFYISVRRVCRTIFSRFCVSLDYGANFFGRIRRMPFVEYVHNRHHIHPRAVRVRRIHIVRYGNKTNVIHRKDIIDVLSDKDIVSAETG